MADYYNVEQITYGGNSYHLKQSSVSVVDNLNSTSTTDALSANQGKVVHDTVMYAGDTIVSNIDGVKTALTNFANNMSHGETKLVRIVHTNNSETSFMIPHIRYEGYLMKQYLAGSGQYSWVASDYNGNCVIFAFDGYNWSIKKQIPYMNITATSYAYNQYTSWDYVYSLLPDNFYGCIHVEFSGSWNIMALANRINSDWGSILFTPSADAPYEFRRAGAGYLNKLALTSLIYYKDFSFYALGYSGQTPGTLISSKNTTTDVTVSGYTPIAVTMTNYGTDAFNITNLISGNNVLTRFYAAQTDYANTTEVSFRVTYIKN